MTATRTRTASTTLARVTGRSVGGLAIIAWGLGWVAWRWLTGAPWRRNPGRRYLQRHVRATLQCAATAAVVGLLVAPVATGIVLAVVITTPLAAAVGYRIRAHLDRRVRVEFGTPVREPRVVDAEVVEATATDRAATTTALIRRLSTTPGGSR